MRPSSCGVWWGRGGRRGPRATCRQRRGGAGPRGACAAAEALGKVIGYTESVVEGVQSRQFHSTSGSCGSLERWCNMRRLGGAICGGSVVRMQSPGSSTASVTWEPALEPGEKLWHAYQRVTAFAAMHSHAFSALLSICDRSQQCKCWNNRLRCSTGMPQCQQGLHNSHHLRGNSESRENPAWHQIPAWHQNLLCLPAHPHSPLMPPSSSVGGHMPCSWKCMPADQGNARVRAPIHTTWIGQVLQHSLLHPSTLPPA
jgi:hypothetical protein